MHTATSRLGREASYVRSTVSFPQVPHGVGAERIRPGVAADLKVALTQPRMKRQ